MDIGSQGRIRIEATDVFEFTDTLGTYDYCLLNNNIYYFSSEKRVKLLNYSAKFNEFFSNLS